MLGRDLAMTVRYKQVKEVRNQNEMSITTWYEIHCPNCDDKLVNLFSPSMFQMHYCFHCGQRLDWTYLKNVIEHNFEE